MYRRHTQYMVNHTELARPTQFTHDHKLLDTISNNDSLLRLLLVSAPISSDGSKYYFKNVSLNYQLNNLIRCARFAKAFILRSPALKTCDMTKLFTFLMNTSCYAYLQYVSDDESDCHIIYENVSVPSGRNGFFGGKKVVLIKKIIIHLDARVDHQSVSGLELIGLHDKNIYLDADEHPDEIMSVILLAGALTNHVFVHLIASQVAVLSDSTQWDQNIVDKMGWSANGMGFSIFDGAFRVICDNDQSFLQAVRSNLSEGMPHPTKFNKFLSKHSKLWHMIKKVHSLPILNKICNYVPNKKLLVAAIVNCSLIHGFDHFLFEETFPFWMESKTLDINLTVARIFMMGFSHDIVSNFGTIPNNDVLLSEMKSIVKMIAPEWENAYQWAVAS